MADLCVFKSATKKLFIYEEMARKSVNHKGRELADDKRTRVGVKLLGHVGAVIDYPLQGNALFLVCDLADVHNVGDDGVRIVGDALKDDHLACFAAQSRLQSICTCHKCLGDVAAVNNIFSTY